MAHVIRHRCLSRRTFLRGSGACLALPWLDAMWPALAGTPTPPLRCAFFFAPNGVVKNAWDPPDEGEGFTLSPTLQPLAAHRERLLVLSGLAQDGGRAHGDGPGDHARAAGSFLTCAHPKKTAGSDVQAGTSIDQVIATALGERTRLPSLEVGMEGGRHTGSCDSGYSCAYSRAISWRTPTTPLAKEVRPRDVFRRLFGDPEALLDATGRARRTAEIQSILDATRADARRLQGKLGAGDRTRLDEYLQAVRELEQRLNRNDAPEHVPMDVLERLSSRDYVERLRLMYELIAIAFETDLTRTITFMVGNAGSDRSYRFLEVAEGHHGLSHHRNDPAKLDKIGRIDHFHVQELARFLDRLAATPEGPGSVLDHAMVLYGSSLGDGNRHSHHDLPLVLAGGGNGTLRGGRHLRYPESTPMANLFLAMLERLGLPTERFADSTGPLTDLG